VGLTKQTGNMYPWVTHTWNPWRGCRFECDYCYVKHLRKRYGYDDTPRLIEKELRTNLGKDRVIFVVSTGDMWGRWVSDDIIIRILQHCFRFYQNEYVFQSKNPARFVEFKRYLANQFWVPNIPFMLGTTIETNRYPGKGKFTLAPSINQRADAMIALKPWKRFVTIEPIMDFDLEKFVVMIRAISPAFVAIGADSKGHGLIEPPAEKVRSLIDELRRFTSVREKENLRRLLG
jgi:protein gp37